MDEQLSFDYSRGPDGLAAWRAARQEKLEHLARKLGIPLGRKVRVDFATGDSLEGLLVLEEEQIFLPEEADARLRLRVGSHGFAHADVVAYVVMETSSRS